MSARYSPGEWGSVRTCWRRAASRVLPASVLGEGEEELLVAGEAVDDGGGLAVERGVPGVVGGGEAGEVGDVFAEGLVAVEVEVGEGGVGVVLLGEGFDGGVEVGEVGGGPPVADVALGVEGGAFGVEGVGDFVADDGADGAVVGGVGGLGIEERAAEDGGGEVEAVVEREVDGVDGLRRHGPLLAVGGLADAARGCSGSRRGAARQRLPKRSSGLISRPA